MRGSVSHFKGVSWHRHTEKWVAQLTVHGRQRHLGIFDAEEDAARAYDAAALELLGADTFLNFPNGAPRPAEETHHRCNRCEKVKPLSGFSPSAEHRLGVRNTCKVCVSAAAIAWREANPVKVLDAHFRRTFGISYEQYVEMAAAQGGVCAICGEEPTVEMGVKSGRHGRRAEPRLVVDHNHMTGEVRGLLCHPCNVGIGMLKDDPDVLKKATRYLEERS